MERVLVTGANGFIGSNVCAYLLERSYEVYGLVRETSDLHFLEGLPVKLIRGDLTNASAIPFPPVWTSSSTRPPWCRTPFPAT